MPRACRGLRADVPCVFSISGGAVQPQVAHDRCAWCVPWLQFGSRNVFKKVDRQPMQLFGFFIYPRDGKERERERERGTETGIVICLDLPTTCL